MKTINKQDFGTFVLHVEADYPFASDETLVQPINAGEKCYIIVARSIEDAEVFKNEEYLQQVANNNLVAKKLYLDLEPEVICNMLWHPIKKAVMLMAENYSKPVMSKEEAKSILQATA